MPSVLFVYRASPHESTGLTPNRLMFGRELELPIDVICSLPQDKYATAPDYIHELQKRIESAHELARTQLKKSACSQRRHYNLKADGTAYEIGSAVMARIGTKTVGLSPKLQPKWDGPYLVTHLLSDVVVRIQRGPRHKPKVLHVNRLKPFWGDVDKSWLIDSLRPHNEEDRQGESQRNEPQHRPENVEVSGQRANEPPVDPQEQVEISDGQRTDQNERQEEDEETEQQEDIDPPSGQEETEILSQRDEVGHQAFSDETDPISQSGKRKRKPPDRYGEWYT